MQVAATPQSSGHEREQRLAMVDRQLRRRGIVDARVLAAFERVPREMFIRPELAEFAYADTALPIDEEQTISQPYIVAYMLEVLHLRGTERVLEVGAGSGYAAAILSHVAADVVAIERHASLAADARRRIDALGRTNVEIVAGDGTRGYPHKAPYDAILVSAGGAVVPDALRQQLAIGGSMIIPVGERDAQRLVRIVRESQETFSDTLLSAVAFVPLIGAEASHSIACRAPVREVDETDAEVLSRHVQPFDDIETVELDPLLERIGTARVVAMGEATHGTSEFYRMRARLSRELIERRGFDVVALEADWPDIAVLDRYVGNVDGRLDIEPFTRFPRWMWRNEEFMGFVEWLRGHNAGRPPSQRVRLCGLDLYSMNHSIAAVLETLESIEPEAARIARERYACLTPWQENPSAYAGAVLSGSHETCRGQVVAVLEDLLAKRMAATADDERLFDAVINARIVADAERYYRATIFGGINAWNLRDEHMFDTLNAVLSRGPGHRAIVWAHNSHVGDARATDFAARGELNLGQLIRQVFGRESYTIGFGTHRGTVMAAHRWDEEGETMTLRPSLEGSVERLCHESGTPQFLLALRDVQEVRQVLHAERLERAVGVVYRPRSERLSHYFFASVGEQFDEYVWFDETSALRPTA